MTTTVALSADVSGSKRYHNMFSHSYLSQHLGTCNESTSSCFCAYDAGISFYGYRFYSPESGRWVSRDPIGEEAFFRRYVHGMDRSERKFWRHRSNFPAYEYVVNSPVDFVDVLGLDLKNTCDKPICYRKDNAWEELPPGETVEGEVDGIANGNEQFKWLDCFDMTITCPNEGRAVFTPVFVGDKHCASKPNVEEQVKCRCKCANKYVSFTGQAFGGGWEPQHWPEPTPEQCPSLGL